MGWGEVFGGLISVGTGLWQADEAKKAADKQSRLAKKIAARNARAIYLENQEVARRQTLAHYDKIGNTRALAGASGMGGLSQQRYLERLKTEAKLEADWMRRSSVLQQEKEIRGGMASASQAKTQGQAQALQGYAQAISGFGQAVGGIDNWIND